MTIKTLLGVSTLAAAALALTLPTAVSARPHHNGHKAHRAHAVHHAHPARHPHKVRVCKVQRHGHRHVKTCHWERR